MDTKKLQVTSTISVWDEAIPLGNGDLGCLIYNTSDKLRFSIDKAGIWDCSAPPELQKDFTYANLYRLVKDGKHKEIVKKYDDCYSNTTPTKLPTGKLVLDLGVKENVVSELDFTTAEAKLFVKDTVVKSFIHATANYGLISVNKKNIGLTLLSPRYGKAKKPLFYRLSKGISQSLKSLHYGSATHHTCDKDGICYRYFVQPTNTGFYGIVCATKETDDGTLIAYTVGISADKTFLDTCLDTVKQALTYGYAGAYATHEKWWQSYFAKSTLEIPDKFIEKNWNFNNYLLAACSRKGHFPMPLQGVWTADNDSLPPWKGDYHHDLNTQMSYTSYLKANRLEEGESFIDYLVSMSLCGKAFAKNFYGVEGLCLPSVMDIEGHALGGWPQYSLSPTNQLWLCQIMARHYDYSQNLAYLKDTMYPFMAETGKFLCNLLKEENGIYKLPLSTSPEIFDNSPRSWLKPNSNYDLALMQAFMQDMGRLSAILGLPNEAKLWQERFEKLEPLAVNADNVLMLDSSISLTESHRHFSHCMAIYPLRSMPYSSAENKKIIDSTILNLENLGGKKWVGFSVGWLANLYTVQENGNAALKTLDTFFRYFCTDNGFHSNGDFRDKTDWGLKYRHFTLEANFLATDAIHNMLLYSEKDGIKLFPALPDTWKTASFDSLRGYGGILVSAKTANGALTYLKIHAENDVTVTIDTKLDTQFSLPLSISLKKGESYETPANL